MVVAHFGYHSFTKGDIDNERLRRSPGVGGSVV
jgi:hypothetical protein